MMRKQVPFGKLRAGSHRAFRPVRNDIDFCFQAAGTPKDFLANSDGTTFYKVLTSSLAALGIMNGRWPAGDANPRRVTVVCSSGPPTTVREWGKRAFLPQGVRDARFFLLPDAAGVDGHHGLAGLATEGLIELEHVLHDTVDAELARRMRIGLHLQAELLGTSAAAPV